MKRIALFLMTNLAVVVVLGIVASLLGVNRYLTANGLNLGALLGFAFIMGFGGAIISLLISKPVAKWSAGVQVIEAPKLGGKTITVSVDGLSGGNLAVNVEGVAGVIVASAGRSGASIAVPGTSTGNVTVTLTPASGAVTYTRVQVELGSAATAFEWRPAAIEILMCMRYFERIAEASRTDFTPGFWFSSTAFYTYVKYGVVKCAAPAVITAAPTNFRVLTIGTGVAPTAFSAFDIGVQGTLISATTGTVTAGTQGILQGNDGVGVAAYFNFEAEL